MEYFWVYISLDSFFRAHTRALIHKLMIWRIKQNMPLQCVTLKIHQPHELRFSRPHVERLCHLIYIFPLLIEFNLYWVCFPLLIWNSIFLEETRDTWGCLRMHACMHHTHKHRHRSAITRVCSMSERETMILWETAVHHFTPHSLLCIMYRYIEQTLASWSDSAQFGTAGHLALVAVKLKECSMCLTALCLFPQ